MALYSTIYLHGAHHPAQDIAHDQLIPTFMAQLDAALVTQAAHFPKKKRSKMIKEWRAEILTEIAEHLALEAGYDEIEFIEHR